MDYSLSARTIISPHFLPSTVKSPYLPSIFPPPFNLNFACRSQTTTSTSLRREVRPPLVVVAKAGSSHCEPSSSSLNTPLEPRTAAGKFLSSVFQNQRELFHVAVADELKLLADDRDGAVSRMFLSSDSDEAFLHRRIAELKEHECQIAVEDIMYMLILFKFSEIRVPLVPKLSSCIYNSRLEIWPSKDWELESIHSFDILEMIREHVFTVIGLRANSSVTDCWATTEIQLLQLGQMYAASILYGYFLKSASLKHYLERCLAVPHQDIHLNCRNVLQLQDSLPHDLSNLVFGHISNVQSVSSGQGSSKQDCKHENLKCYVMGFDAETLQRCAKLKSKEAVNLIEKHSCALFGNDKNGLLENDEVILTSFSSLRRLILEAVAFGSFLWDTEEYVSSVFKLNENY
ncbi:hypothetical protein P3X46_017957 [Hevea brasiliensis]|uniref:UV-B-induced protein n=1 Tax=Hevea brasiliensis TaxID=3981 RepID=A0ABQ9LT94_HEVBR|nr:UV-B-induced protein At3g17800, chloroplastic [Hevea brasiliensis]KAJ9169806.1 hypothetical protein P3X46_017957 [Hevea brasiliensis]